MSNMRLVVLIIAFFALTSAAVAQADDDQGNKTTYSKIVNIDDRLTNIETEISAIQSRFGANFEDQFGRLIQIIFALFAVSVTAVLFIANTWIKERVTSLHDAELEKAKIKLNTLVNTANADVGANIYTTIGGHCIDLYKNFDEPSLGGRHHKLYQSYVSMAVRIAANAYLYASRLEEFLDSRPPDSLTPAERKKYKKVIDYALNNYVFYLAQRGYKQDKHLLRELLPKLIKIASERKENNEERWWDFEDTVIWAKLNIDRNNAITCREEISVLMTSPSVDTDWRMSVKERYDLYNKTCFHEAEKIFL